MNNKWTRGAIPALLIHLSIGSVYCWSLFSQEVANYIGFSKGAIEWAFSLAIFFLGMSAAFMGNIVEKDIKKSSLISLITFCVGLIGTGFFIWYGGNHQGSLVSLIGIYISYGVIMGIGLGTGYLTPVKTLMLWFKEHKGLATGIAITGFGASKAIFSPLIVYLLGKVAVYNVFFILSSIFFLMLLLGHLMIKKPEGWAEDNSKFSPRALFKTLSKMPIRNYISIWLMFFLNITCGLMIISQEKMIVNSIGLIEAVGIISMFSAIFNALGRFGFSTIGDKLKDRNTIYKVIFAMSIAATAIVAFSTTSNKTIYAVIMIAMIMIINAGYGGGFSNMPSLLGDYYGMESVSTIHGITLSAWGFAGLAGNQIANLVINNSYGITGLVTVAMLLFIPAMILSLTIRRKNCKIS